jgi:O-antigen/teichoic acid export membrane protein
VTARSSYSAGAGFSALSFAVGAVLTVASSVAIARLYGISVVGQFALVLAPVNVVWLLSSVRQGPAVVRKLAVLEPRAPLCTALFVAVLSFSFVLTTCAVALALPVTYVVFNGPIDQPDLFVPVAVSLAGHAVLTNSCLNLELVFSAFRAGRALFWIRLHQAVVFLAVAVALSSVLDDVWGLIVATLVSFSTTLVHRIVAVRSYMALTVSRAELREGFRSLPDVIRFGLKITPGSLANGMSTEVGTWVLGATASVATLGAYSRAWMLASRLQDANWRIAEMLFPTLVARHAGGDDAGFDRAVVDTLRYCAAGLLLPAAAAGGAASSVMALYGPGFDRGAPALALLLIVPAAVTLASVQRQALLAVGRPWITSAIAAAKLAVTVVLSFALTLWFGITGTALALVVGSLVEVIWLTMLTDRQLTATLGALWPLRQAVAILAAFAAGFGVAHAVASALPGISGLLPALAAGALSYALALVIAGGINDRDRRRAGAVLARVRHRSRVAPA